MTQIVTICANGECGGECYRCRCERLDNYATALRQAIRAIATGEIVLVESAPGEWLWCRRGWRCKAGEPGYHGPFKNPVDAALDAVDELESKGRRVYGERVEDNSR